MSATDTSQPSSDFLKSSRVQGDFELNSWTQGLGGAPRPNPLPASSLSTQAPTISTQAPTMSPQNPHSLSTGLNMGAVNTTPTNRYAQTNSAMRYDQKVSSSSQSSSSNPFLSSPSLGHGSDNRPDLRGNLREAWNQAQTSDLQSFDLSTYVQSQGRPSASPPPQSRDYAPPKTDQLSSGSGFSASGFNEWGRQSGTAQENIPHQAAFDQLSVADNSSGSGDHEDYDTDGSGGSYEPRFANKKILISTVLIGALVLGGGVSYLYNSFFGGASEGPTPLVKNAQGPSKVKPSDPGGKQFAHSDSKILGRLNDTSSVSESDSSAEARKVSTLVVGRDGTIQTPSATEAQNVTPSVSVPVPGMTLIDGAPTNGRAASSSAENVPGAGTLPVKPEITSSGIAKPSEAKVSDNTITKETAQQQNAASSKSSTTDTGAQVAAVSTTALTASSNPQGPASTASTKSSESSQQTKPETASPSSSSEGKTKSTLTEADLVAPTSQKKLASGA
ncbi:MAG: hypothetical protein ACKOW3_08105, partial [Hyphomicrobium sp.]